MRSKYLPSVCLLALLAYTPNAYAQAAEEGDVMAESGAPGSDIVVTARKRAESEIDVPIQIAVVGADELSRRAIMNLSDLSASTPNLNVATNSGPHGGGLTLRGVGAGATGSYTVDQAVAVNIDGISITHGSGVNFAQFDLAQIEILKGPQALYYGKNASAGVISIASADPTSDLFVMGRIGYEFSSDELLTEAVISGPISDTVGARLALYRTSMDGYFRNPLQAGETHPTYGVLGGPTFRRAPHVKDVGLRGTLKYEPDDRLTVKAKVAFEHRSGSPSAAQSQLFFCPLGQPQSRAAIPGVGDCTLDKTALPLAPAATAEDTGDARFGDGALYSSQKQSLAALNMDYQISDALVLSAIVGRFRYNINELANGSWSTAPTVSSYIDQKKVDWSQEVRLTSDFAGPFNFMVGGYFSQGEFYIDAPASLDPGATGVAGFPFAPSNPSDNAIWDIRSHSWSTFGQAIIGITDQLELSVGGRYTFEKKKLSLAGYRIGEVALGRPSRSFKKFTPDVTLAFKPTPDLNIYATYKQATKSGGFNVGSIISPPYDRDYTYGDELAKGFEVGVKTAVLDRQLRLDANIYSYRYSDLQVAAYDPATIAYTILNAATSKIEGVELNASFRPRGLEGFRIGGSVNYNHARFADYIGPCYTGQSRAAGCTIIAPGATVPGQQDYGGRPLSKAPRWSGSVQAEYEGDVSDRLRFGISWAGNYNSSYFSQADLPPAALQRPAWILDGQIRLFEEGDRWELALIGRNLTDELRIQSSIATTFTPTLPAGTGTDTVNLPDYGGYANRPRSVQLRLTVKY